MELCVSQAPHTAGSSEDRPWPRVRPHRDFCDNGYGLGSARVPRSLGESCLAKPRSTTNRCRRPLNLRHRASRGGPSGLWWSATLPNFLSPSSDGTPSVDAALKRGRQCPATSFEAWLTNCELLLLRSRLKSSNQRSRCRSGTSCWMAPSPSHNASNRGT